MQASEGYANNYEDRLCRFVLSRMTPWRTPNVSDALLRPLLTIRRRLMAPRRLSCDHSCLQTTMCYALSIAPALSVLPVEVLYAHGSVALDFSMGKRRGIH